LTEDEALMGQKLIKISVRDL